jgi:hypothetical protein
MEPGRHSPSDLEINLWVFGLLALGIVLGLAMWWLTSVSPTTP